MIVLTWASAALAVAVGCSYVYADLNLNRMGLSATDIGLNASMPPLAWLLGTPLLPWFLRRVDVTKGVLGLLVVAGMAAAVFPLTDDLGAWMAARFVFGGACGLVFRLVEYWINAAAPERHRTRDFGIYAAGFCIGAAVGAAIAPTWGIKGWPPVLLMIGFLMVSFLSFAALVKEGPSTIILAKGTATGFTASMGEIMAAGGAVALVCAALFGMFEPVPYSLMPVYTVRSGLSDGYAALTASAFLLGQVLFLVPLGMATDRYGKAPMLCACGAAALLIALSIPIVVDDHSALLVAMLFWGGFAGALYLISLALLGDLFSGAALVRANAAFGTLYALGALIGPSLHGIAMDWRDPEGLVVSATIVLGTASTAAFHSLWKARRERRLA